VLGDRACFQEHHGAMVFACLFQLLVVRGAGHHSQLLGYRQPFLRVVGSHQHVQPAGQHVAQRRGIAQRPGQGDRLPAECITRPAVGLVPQRSGNGEIRWRPPGRRGGVRATLLVGVGVV
jgi:hypothetical protein